MNFHVSWLEENVITEMLFSIAILLILAALLWVPTCAVFVGRRMPGERRQYAKLAVWMLGELLVAATISLLCDWIGLLNPAGYVIAITVAVSVLGALSARAFTQRPANTTLHTDATRR